MKKTVLAIWFFSILSVDGWCQTINRIIAVVNDEVITSQEFEHKKAFLLRQIKQSRGEISEAQQSQMGKILLEKLIINKLVMQEARAQKIEVTDEEIEEMVNRVRRNFPNEATFRRSLEESGLKLEDLNESYKFEIILGRLFFDKIRQKIVVTPTEIEEFYREHKTELKQPEIVCLSNIFIKKEGLSFEEISAKLEAIRALLKEGADFKETAKKFSEGANAFKGGQMGEIKRGELSLDVEEIIFNLKPYEISEWIETASGFYLFRVEEIKPGRELDFNEAQAQIKASLTNQKMNEEFDKWIGKLKENAYIKIYE